MTDISFGRPLFLLAIPVVALLGWLLVRWRARRPGAGLPYPDLDELARVDLAPRRRRHLPLALAALAALLLTLGIAKPQMPQDQARKQSTIMLAVDVSGSMAADDVEPYRLRAAQDAALRFADRVPRAYEVGLVSFSGGAAVIVPPTTDRLQLKAGIESLQAGGATAIGEAIVASLQAIEERQGGTVREDSARLLLLSDGSNTDGISVAEAVDRAQGAGVPVFTVALGTQEGTLPDGRPVPPDVASLELIAEQTGGQAFESRDADSVAEVYEKLGSFIGTERVTAEVTGAVAGLGLLALLLAGAAWWRWGVRLG